ncbi:MAG: lycopene cyclase domain-containing protein [Actinomycetia bacterium]|nr:lycopene cyclase domain-containing protein [Actinomycetes bacterium]
MTYTQLTLLGVAATVVLDLVVLRTRVLLRRTFWVAYAIIVFFQLLTNGVLTGFRIVRYDGAAIIGSGTPVLVGDGRLVFAPVEDLLFGFALVVQTLAWWVFWGRRGVQRTPTAGPAPTWWPGRRD